MINVITEHGSSFKGLAAYVLHDIDRADTSERVAWTETHGLATDDPDKAWRIMAATAMSQADLKAQAGVKNTGNKSHKHVMHYVLSWHHEEHGEITKEEMIAAAKASMTYLGTYEGERLGKNKKTGKDIYAKRTQHADEHQALIVCHDEPDKTPHVHIMLNRVHPEHGVMLPDSMDFAKLSAWALDYRTAQGKEHYCEQRRINAAKRAQGILAQDPRKPRNIYEQEQAIDQADPGSRKKAQLEEQRRRAKILKAKTEALKSRQVEGMQQIEDRYLEGLKAERAATQDRLAKMKNELRAAYAEKLDALAKDQGDERKAFEAEVKTLKGRASLGWEHIKSLDWMKELSTKRTRAVTENFKTALTVDGLRDKLGTKHAQELRELKSERLAAERDEARGIRTDEGFKLDTLRQRFAEERNDLILTGGMEKAKIKAEWQELEKDRLAVKIEDERAKHIKADADRTGGSGSSGGRQPEKRADTPPLADQTRQATTPPPVYDIPIEQLREITRELTQPPEDEQEQDPDHEIER